jgi:hypothetical protein
MNHAKLENGAMWPSRASYDVDFGDLPMEHQLGEIPKLCLQVRLPYFGGPE